MPDFTIETTYHLPIFRQRTYTAETLEAACATAVADEDWDSDNEDRRASGETYVSHIWDGPDSLHSDTLIPVPEHFGDSLKRRARQFEILLGLIRIVFNDARAARSSSRDWLAQSAWAIAHGDAILSGLPEPTAPGDTPMPIHVLACLQEARVRDAIAAIIDVDPDFSGLVADRISDEDIHSACLETVATLSFSDEIGDAEFRTAMVTLQAVRSRLQSQ